MVNKGNKRNNKANKNNYNKSKPRPSGNGTQKSVALVLITKNPTGKTAEQRNLAMSRSFFDRNNKTVRNSYKKNLHTINQPATRTMSRKN